MIIARKTVLASKEAASQTQRETDGEHPSRLGPPVQVIQIFERFKELSSDLITAYSGGAPAPPRSGRTNTAF